MMEELKAGLKLARRKNIDSRMFMPELALYKVMNMTDIHRALKSAKIGRFREEEMAALIMSSGAKIFAILVLTGQPADVERFIELSQLHDVKLPFELNVLRDDIKVAEPEDFEEKQWEFTAPKFKYGTLNRQFRKDTVFPFVAAEVIGKGGFGIVRSIKLDENHQEIDETFHLEFAQKELGSSKDFQTELENLSLLNRLQHPNIIRLLSSYTYREKYYLLFPLVSGGTLSSLIETERAATQFSNDEVFLTALVGLSSAIEQVHDFFEHKGDLELIGCHHDLRLRNILISGTAFVLADFGISRFKETTNNSATTRHGGRDDYLAPECDNPRNGPDSPMVSRSSDIWSFGCIIAELATYMAQGADGVKRFEESRLFRFQGGEHNRFYHGSDKNSDTVMAWLIMLEQSKVISCGMLANLSRLMLNIDRSARPKARNVTSILRMITLSTISTVIDELFHKTKGRNDSFDSRIEHTRFTAWRYAARLLKLDSPMAIVQDYAPIDGPKYDSVLDHLRQIRNCLQQSLTLKDNIQVVLSDLPYINDRLHDLLDAKQQEQARIFFRISFLDSSNLELVQWAEFDGGGLPLDREIRMRAALKHMTLQAMNYSTTSAHWSQIPATCVRTTGILGEHSVGEITLQDNPRRVLVEWRRYDDVGANKTVSKRLFQRLNAITEKMSADKPALMRALHCSGYYHNESKYSFGMLYDFPGPGAEQDGAEPINLRKHITDTYRDMKTHPALDDKFSMALILARSVLEFHLVGWLHKNLTAENIAFFPVTGEACEAWIKRPYIIGFNHSRPDDPLEPTEGTPRSTVIGYQNLQYRQARQGYRAEYDYYSLGVILAEIGFWTPLDKIVGRGNEFWDESHDTKLKRRISRLVQYMGRDYYAAVKACIDGEWDRAGDSREGNHNNKALHIEFHEKVLDRLSGSLSATTMTYAP